jgi:hypothetical protein
MVEGTPFAVCPASDHPRPQMTAIADASLPPGGLGGGREDTDGPTREPRRSMFLHASRRELDDPDQARLPDRVHADLLFELPASQGASLGEWLGCAAVEADVEADGVIVRAHANRVFRLADVAGVVREWMQAHSVDAVLASSDEGLFTISTHETGP